MPVQDHYARLGVAHTASQADVKRAYRKLARKYHPDLSKEPQAEARFKEVAEANEVLSHPERRAAYDDSLRQASPRAQAARRPGPPPVWSDASPYGHHDGQGDGMFDGGLDGGLDGELLSALFGRSARPGRPNHPHRPAPMTGADEHAEVRIDLEDIYQGATKTITIHGPMGHAQGQPVSSERTLEVHIPRGVRAGQRLRLAGQGAAGHGGAASGDLYLEIALRPHPLFKVEARDVYVALPVAPWEAALGATVTAPTPTGQVELSIPPGSSPGRKLRLKGRGLPSQPPGDLYAVLEVAWPPADSADAKAAYAAMAQAFARFNPRPGAHGA
jgi:curved DNA-binding protein